MIRDCLAAGWNNMALWIIAALVSAFIKGLCGVGDAPVFSSILAFRYDNIQISPVSVLLSLPANVLLAFKNRKALKRSIWLPLSVLIICGNVPGILLLKNSLDKFDNLSLCQKTIDGYFTCG